METNTEGRASREVMETLHRLLAEQILATLKAPRVSAAKLAVARAFLADNGVNIATIQSRREVAEKLDDLLAEMPFEEAEGEPA